MWKRFGKLLRCPLCFSELSLHEFEWSLEKLDSEHLRFAADTNVIDSDFGCFIEEGVLTCKTCRRWFPINGGVPILLTFKTSLHDQFRHKFRSHFSATHLGDYKMPEASPVAGEEFVLDSFSKEWGEYQYDGVLWEATYDDLEARFLREMGVDPSRQIIINRAKRYLEAGCGLGVTTYFAQKHLAVDAVGIDLSCSVAQACRQYRSNPFVHFVQASVFHLPFADGAYDLIYSRGALHHTYSTRDALTALARVCHEDGLLYLWVYGKRSVNDNLFRRFSYFVESLIRPMLSRHPDAAFSKVALMVLGLGYVGFNTFRRFKDSSVQRYSFRRAIHAARDRFTPLYAQRHEPSEVEAWFRELGFNSVQLVNWKEMPPVEQDDFRRNIGVRARRAPAKRTVLELDEGSQ